MKKLFALMLAGIMVLGLFGCGAKEEAPAAPAAPSAPAASAPAAPAAPAEPEADPIVFKFTYSEPEDSIFGKAMPKAAEKITEQTNGRIQFEIFPANQLGSLTDMLEQQRSGAPLICSMGFDNLGDIVPAFAPASFPYVFNDCYEVLALAKSDWIASLEDDLVAADIYPVSMGSSGYRHFISTFEINSAADCKGHIMRMGPSGSAQGFITVMGGNPTTTTWADNYSLLQTGVIESCEAALNALMSSSLGEVCDYLALSGHFVTPFVLTMHPDYWFQMTEEEQKIMQDCFAEAATEILDETMANEENYIQQFKDMGVTVTEPDKASFAAVVPQLFELLDMDPAIYDDIRAAIDANK